MERDAASQRAFDAKRAARSALSGEAVVDANRSFAEVDALGLIGPDYDDFSVGTFEGLESIRLRWAAPDWFEFIPHPPMFAFIRASGERIQLGRMFTDGGSIPRIGWLAESLSPWGYAPAYLVHDWEFDLHHCNLSDKRFEEVRDTMMEAIKTLMEQELAPRAPVTFQIIYAGINSSIAHSIWDRPFETCPLPPDPLA